MLQFVAMHSLVVASQVEHLLQVEEGPADRRLDRLVAAGWLRRGARFRHQYGVFQITDAGLRSIGSELPCPLLQARRYWHVVQHRLSHADLRTTSGYAAQRVEQGEDLNDVLERRHQTARRTGGR